MLVKDIDINYNLIKAEVKPGYVVFNNNGFHVVTKVDENTVNLDNGLVISYQEAEENIAKFVATDSNKTYAVRHTDFQLLVYLLNQEDKDNNSKYTTAAEALINGEVVRVKGYLDFTHSTLRNNEIVTVTDIKVIDSLKLYDTNKRLGKVLFSGRGSVNIELINVKEDDKSNRNKMLKVARESVEPTEHPNLFFMYRICCPFCKR